MPTKSVVGAVITGMFGIPTDPRLIEVLGWLLYAAPVMVVFLWPARYAPAAATKGRIKAVAAVALAAAAVAMALFIPAAGGASPGPTRAVVTVGGEGVTATLRADGTARALVIVTADGKDRQVPLAAAGRQAIDGLDVDVWQATASADPGVTTTPIALGQLADVTGGRLPVGLGNTRTPGPFNAQWSARTVYTVLAHGDDVVTAEAASTRVATLDGGGLVGPKTVSLGGLATDWATPARDDEAIAARITESSLDRTERTLWTVWLPTVLAISAIFVVLAAVRTNRRNSRHEREQPRHGGTHGQAPSKIGVS
jgi:high-affinity iron transporter